MQAWPRHPRTLMDIGQTMDSKSAAQSLKRVILDSKYQGEGDCAICMEPLRGKLAAHLPCGHSLHSRCLRDFKASGAANAYRCPLCRAQHTKAPPLPSPELMHFGTGFTVYVFGRLMAGPVDQEPDSEAEAEAEAEGEEEADPSVGVEARAALLAAAERLWLTSGPEGHPGDPTIRVLTYIDVLPDRRELETSP